MKLADALAHSQQVLAAGPVGTVYGAALRICQGERHHAPDLSLLLRAHLRRDVIDGLVYSLVGPEDCKGQRHRGQGGEHAVFG